MSQFLGYFSDEALRDRFVIIEPRNDAFEQLVSGDINATTPFTAVPLREGQLGRWGDHTEESARRLPNAGPPGFVPPHPDLEARYRK